MERERSLLYPKRLLLNGHWRRRVVTLEVFQFQLSNYRDVQNGDVIDSVYTVLAPWLGRQTPRRYRHMIYYRNLTLLSCQSWLHILFEAAVYCFCVWCGNLKSRRQVVKKGWWIWGESKENLKPVRLNQNPQGRARTCGSFSRFPSFQLQSWSSPEEETVGWVAAPKEQSQSTSHNVCELQQCLGLSPLTSKY